MTAVATTTLTLTILPSSLTFWVSPSATGRDMVRRPAYGPGSPLMPVMGMTRIANVTGLDIIGVPVVMVC